MRIEGVHVRNSAGTPTISKQDFRGAAQSLQAKRRNVTSD